MRGWAQNAGISADRLGNVYFAGSIISASNGPKEPSDDAFIGKYDDQGNLIWIKRLHATSWATGGAVSADGLGNVYFSGSSGDWRMNWKPGTFVAKFDVAGTRLWHQEFGSTDTETGRGVAADQLGNVYVGGATIGSLGGPNAGGDDAFLVKLVPAGGMLAWLFVPGSIATLVGLRFLLGLFR